MVANGLKVRIAVFSATSKGSACFQPRKRVLSSKMIIIFKKINYILLNHKCLPFTSSAMCVRDFTHYVITLKCHAWLVLRLYTLIHKGRVG